VFVLSCEFKKWIFTNEDMVFLSLKSATGGACFTSWSHRDNRFYFDTSLLVELELSQLATFEKARVELASGLNILSGMSGAGKSVLLKALDLVLGGRFSQKLMREGADQSEVSGLFILPEHLCKIYTEDLVLAGEEVLIRRVFRREGRTSNYINDRMVSVDLLKRLGQDLARVLNQDEALGLRDPEHQLSLLDLFGGLVLDRQEVEAEFALWRQKLTLLNQLKQSSKDAVERKQFAQFQLEELKRLRLSAGEFENLGGELKLLGSSSELEAYGEDILSSADAFVDGARGPLENMQAIVGKMDEWKALIDEGLGLVFSCEEWLRIFRQQKDSLEFDPERLGMVENRYKQLTAVFKKFAKSESELLDYRDELLAQVEGPSVDIEIEEISIELQEIEKALKAKAKKLHQKRELASKNLSLQVNKILANLEMSGDRFCIELGQADLNQHGCSSVIFTLRPTADASPKPLHESASGGERSRALLAISSALKGSLGCPLLVFDEIDTNMGARLGRPISEAFLNLAQGAQVICVTHLAPVAACGGRHFVVEKGSLVSEVKCLDEAGRVLELAQMTAGDRHSVKAQEQAREMLDFYRKVKA
jgi:DNA repair protein RecN (Recombination protein N)